MASKGPQKIQWRENYNTSLEKTGSNPKQTIREVREEKRKVTYGPNGEIKSTETSAKILREKTTWGKGYKAGAGLQSMMYPAIAD